MDWKKALTPGNQDLTASEHRFRQIATAVSLVGALGIVVYTSIWMAEPEPVSPPSPSVTNDFTLRSEDLDREVFAAKYDRRLKDLEVSMAKAERLSADLQKAVDALVKTDKGAAGTPSGPQSDKPSPLVIAPVVGDGPNSEAARRLRGEIPPGPAFAGYVPPPSDGSDPTFHEAADAWATNSFSPRPAQTPRPKLAIVTFMKQPKPAKVPQPTVADAVYDARPTLRHDDPLAANRALGATANEYLTAGTLARGTLLTGVYAPTGGSGMGTPVPILIDLSREALLPNGFRADLTDCRVTGNATGDLSSERILVRLERLACVGPRGAALDIRVRGYVTGPDGKVGLRGKLVMRSGQAIARSFLVGALSGLGKAVSIGSSETTTFTNGSQSTVYRNSLKAGVGEGTASALDRLADYYLDLAEKIFPVLEVDGGQAVDIVFSQGVLLEKPKGKQS